MSRAAIKNLFICFLAPFTVIVRKILTPIKRAWMHASLSMMIDGKVDPSTVMLMTPEVHGTKRIILGKNLLLYRGIYLETQEEGSIKIEDDSVLSRGVHIVSYSNVSIGKGTIIGEYSSLRDANHKRKEGVAIRHSGFDAKPITIGANVWIGRGVTILPGVSIGDHATIGANAVVTKDVPANAVYVGVPARSL